jgi:AGZA family xanthine/uracil permease-like MFS transporter
MGLNLFIVTYSDYNGVPWPYLLIVCGVVSVVVFWTSLTSFRYELLKAVPDQIIAAIKAGVGAILATVPIHEIGRFANDQDRNGHVAGPILALSIFAIGLVVIFGIKLLCANMTRRSEAEQGIDQVLGGAQMSLTWIWDILDSGAFFVSIIVLILLIWILHPPQNFNVEESIYITWSTAGALLSPFHSQYLTNSIGFAIAVFVMMTIDIAGSPIDYLRQNFVAKNDQEAAKLTQDDLVASDDIVVIGDDEQRVLIRKGLWIDSFFNLVAAAVGITPVVFYAENHAGWQAKGRSGLTTMVVSGCFLVFAVAALICIWLGLPIVRVIPQMAIMPTLFFVGTAVVADSFIVPARVGDTFNLLKSGQLTTSNGGSVGGHAKRTPRGQTLFFVPAAITAILVPITESLDISVAAGIVAHLLITQFPEEYLGVRDETSWRLTLIYLGAGLILLLSLVSRNWASP